MYREIEKIKPVCELYANKIIKEGVISQTEYDTKMKDLFDQYNKAYLTSKNEKFSPKDW